MFVREGTRAVSVRGSLPGISLLLLLLGCAFLTGCAAGGWSTEDPHPLGKDLREAFPDLAACLPPPPEDWTAAPVVINKKNSLLGAGALEATAEYKGVEGAAEMEIRIHTSPWAQRLVSRSQDLEKLSFQGRQAGLDARKDKAELYVLLHSNYVAVFEAFHTPEGARTVVDFASATDFDCLEAGLLGN